MAGMTIRGKEGWRVKACPIIQSDPFKNRLNNFRTTLQLGLLPSFSPRSLFAVCPICIHYSLQEERVLALILSLFPCPWRDRVQQSKRYPLHLANEGRRCSRVPW